MRYTENLRNILEQQQAQTNALAQAVAEIEQTDLAGENDRLRQEVEKVMADFAHLSDENKRLNDENKYLLSGLREQWLAERLGIGRHSREQLLFYYGQAEASDQDRLTMLEEKYRALLDKLKDSTARDVGKTDAALQAKLDETTLFVQEALLSLKLLQKKKSQALRENLQADYDALEAEPLPDSKGAERLRLFNMEMRFGIKVVNILGILLILLGVVFGLQYTYVNLLRTDALKAAAAYLLGILFLCGGEWARRRLRDKNFFAVGITAGGLGILFAATAMAYFNLHVLSALPAAGLCVFLSLLSFWMSLRYNARTVAVMALVGGYLPLAAFSEGSAALVAVCAYIALLNALTLFLATQRKWPVLNGLALAFYALASLYILHFQALPVVVGTVFIALHFLLFLTAILLYPAAKRLDHEVLTQVDIGLLAVNTLINCAYLYGFLQTREHFIFTYQGWLAVFFCTAFYAAARASKRFLPAERRVRALFLLTALTFALLVPPFVLELDVILMGWLAEGLLLLAYGVYKKERWFERAGIGVMVLAFVMFVPQVVTASLYNWAWTHSLQEQPLFFLNYSLITAGLWVVMLIYFFAYKSDSLFTFTPKGKRVNAYSYAAVIFGCLYLRYAVSFVYAFTLGRSGDRFWLLYILVVCGFLCGAVIKYLPMLHGQAKDYISLGMLVLCGIVALALNVQSYPASGTDMVLSRVWIPVFNLMALAAVCEGLRGVRKMTGGAAHWQPLVATVFALVLVLMTLVVQYQIGVNSILLSAVGLLAAFGWIWFGFMGRNRLMRLFGLGFALFATAKLFLIDLYFLENMLRVLSYFMFGAVLLGISFLYQYFNKKLTRML